MSAAPFFGARSSRRDRAGWGRRDNAGRCGSFADVLETSQKKSLLGVQEAAEYKRLSIRAAAFSSQTLLWSGVGGDPARWRAVDRHTTDSIVLRSIVLPRTTVICQSIES